MSFTFHASRFRIHVSGFTMIELMVTIGIFALITGAVLANFRSGERGESLRLAAEQLAQDIRRAQGDVLSGKTATYQEQGDAEAKEQAPISGYGIEFALGSDAGHYALFVMSKGGVPTTPSLSLTALPKGIVIQDIKLDGIASERLLIGFRPPDAAAFFQTVEGGFPSNAPEAVVTLRHTITDQERRIIVNRISGKVSVE